MMRTKRIAIISAALILTAWAARAQTPHVWSDPSGWWDAHYAYDVNAPIYKGDELSLDLFGSYLNPEGQFNELFETNIRHGFWGGGAGLNYFFSSNLGLGADFNISSKQEGRLEDFVVGNLVVRFPIGNSGIAPYAIGGGGRGMSPVWQWVYGGGVGVEYRWNPSTGIFTDARFLWGEKGTMYNSLVIRAGLRIVL